MSPTQVRCCFIIRKQTETWYAAAILLFVALSAVAAVAAAAPGNKVPPKLSGETTMTATPSNVTTTEVAAKIGKSGEYCASIIAGKLYRSGIDSTQDLKRSGVNGRPFEILKNRIREKEQLAKRRAAAKAHAFAISRASTSGGKTRSSGRWSTVRYGSGTERWRSYVKQCLRSRPDLVPVAMRIINGESHGNPGCIGGGGNLYYGIVQFGPGWVKEGTRRYVPRDKWGSSADWRMNPYTAIAVMCNSISHGGIHNWAATAY